MAAVRLLHVVILCYFGLHLVTGDDCEQPPKIKNGQVRSVTENGIITAYYSCNRGFTNIGESNITCLSSGKWEKLKIKCVPVCPDPPLPVHAVIAHVSTPTYKHGKGSRIFYKCEQGYHLAGLMFIYCLGQQWTRVKFSCIESKDCSTPRSPEHGERIGDDFSVGKKVWYLCKAGFAIHGRKMLQCLQNRTWDSHVPVCKVVDCGSLPVPLHGKKTKETKTIFKGRAEFDCGRKDYTFRGSKIRICQANGKWSGKPAICLAPCNNPGAPTNGERIGNNFGHGTTVRFRCSESYKMRGPRRIICYDGNWTNKRPRCLLPSQMKDYSQCGVRGKIRRSRMVGGLPSARGMWPWQVGLYRQMQRSDKQMFICGGALINRQWIVTAAHCFMYTDPDDNARRPLLSSLWRYKVAIGDSHRNRTEGSQHAFFVGKIIMHPHYHDDFKDNDIALVKLSSRVTFEKYIRKVCLPVQNSGSAHQDSVLPGSTGHVAGWGSTQVLKPGQMDTTDPVKSSSLELLSAQFQIENVERCRNSTDYHFNESISFCAGSNRSGVGMCRGDSGGPFVMNIMQSGQMKWVAVGLVSWGEGCGTHGRYTFYTKLAPYIEWINNQTKHAQ